MANRLILRTPNNLQSSNSDLNVEYGLLYNWYAINDARNITASGWHIATSDEEYVAYSGDVGILLKYLDPSVAGTSSTIAGDSMRENGYWTDENGTNISGFNGRGSGQRTSSGFSMLANNLIFWTPGLYDGFLGVNSRAVAYLTYTQGFDIPVIGMGAIAATRNDGISVRLVKDSTTLTNGQAGTYVGNDGKVYRTICIGTQEWLADNLCETRYRNGDDIPEITDNATWGALTTGALCAYDNDWNNAYIENTAPKVTVTQKLQLRTISSVQSSSLGPSIIIGLMRILNK